MKRFDSAQSRILKSLSGGHMMISGAPGSGKSLVLCAKIKSLLEENERWRVLLLCYNKCSADHLRNYFQSLSNFAGNASEKLLQDISNRVDVFSFHLFCHSIFKKTNTKLPVLNKKQLSKTARFQNESVDFESILLGRKLYEVCVTSDLPLYDAIFVDESQDFYPSWLESLPLLLNGSTNFLVLAEDPTQRIYTGSFSYNNLGSYQSLGINIDRDKVFKMPVSYLSQKEFDLINPEIAKSNWGEFYEEYFESQPYETPKEVPSKESIDLKNRVMEADKKFKDVEIISEDCEIGKIKIRISQTAPIKKDDITYLILGEQGTGKGLFAKAIHRASGRSNFVKVDCGALSETLFESELFGHDKGAFSGAVRDKEGPFARVSDGVLFLNEIGNLTKRTQAKLLGVLQEREFQPVGSSKTIRVNALIVLDTNKDLNQMVKDDKFMGDLYSRFKRPQYTIPPLRKRKGDIAPLARHFIEIHDVTLNEKTDLEPININEDCINVMKNYEWPGNVRELELIIKEIMLNRVGSKDRSEITPEDLPSEILENKKYSFYGPGKKKKLPGNKKFTDEDLNYLMEALNHNKTHVAKKLGVSNVTIWRRWKKIESTAQKE